MSGFNTGSECTCTAGLMGKLFSKQTSGLNRRQSFDDNCCEYGNATFDSIFSPNSNAIRQYPPAHNDIINSLSPVSNGLCLSAGSDANLVIYNFQTGNLHRKWGEGHSKAITKCVSSPEGKNGFLSGSRDTTICFWSDSGDQRPVRTFTGHALVVSGLDYTLDASKIVSGSRDNHVRVWDVETGISVIDTSISRNLVTDLKCFPAETLMAQTSEDKELRLWDCRTLQNVHSFPKMKHIHTSCDVITGLCVTGSNGCQGEGCDVAVWDVRAQKILCEMYGHQQSVTGVRFLRGTTARLCVSVSSDCTVRLWDMDTSQCINELFMEGVGPLQCVTTFLDNYICVGSFNKSVHVLKVVDECRLVRVAQY